MGSQIEKWAPSAIFQERGRWILEDKRSSQFGVPALFLAWVERCPAISTILYECSFLLCFFLFPHVMWTAVYCMRVAQLEHGANTAKAVNSIPVWAIHLEWT